jgi:hypothetical protein
LRKGHPSQDRYHRSPIRLHDDCDLHFPSVMVSTRCRPRSGRIFVEYLAQHNPGIDENGIQRRKEQYGDPREVPLEAGREVTNIPSRAHPKLNLWGERTDPHQRPQSPHMHPTSSVPVIPSSERSPLLHWARTPTFLRRFYPTSPLFERWHAVSVSSVGMVERGTQPFGPFFVPDSSHSSSYGPWPGRFRLLRVAPSLCIYTSNVRLQTPYCYSLRKD